MLSGRGSSGSHTISPSERALEDALQEANDALEARVHERTAQLAQRNEALASEVRTREAEEPKSGNYSFDW